jgi:hypothetical protein
MRKLITVMIILKILDNVHSFTNTCNTIVFLLSLSLITFGVVFLLYCTAMVAILGDLLGVASYISSYINVFKYLYAIVI